MHQELLPFFQQYLLSYGYIALLVLLAVGIFGLPVPDETLMTLSGFLMAQGKLPIPATVVAAICGSILGISISYVLGRTAGTFLIARYGRYIGLTSEKMEKMHRWFEKFGKWSLFIGYFIPGVRHFTGYVAGIVRLEYHLFALFAYIGAVVWVITFLSLGYFVGTQWDILFEYIEDEIFWILFVIFVISVFLFYLFYLYKKFKQKIVKEE